MIATLLQMFVLILAGLVWSLWRPGQPTEAARRTLVTPVFYLFLPALVLLVLWRAELGSESWKIALAAAIGILAAVAVSAAICRLLRVANPNAGALVLAAAWPNVTYLGLPLLEQQFGSWASGVAIQYDLFACTPLLLTLGVGLASRYGTSKDHAHPLLALTKVPPLWAALAAVVLNLAGIPMPKWIEQLLRLASGAVVPLMLVSVGMALRQGFAQWRQLPLAIPVVLVKLLLMPLIVWGVATIAGINGDHLVAVVLEGAMPSMVIGLVLADRYGLNSGLFAAALTVTTLLSLLTLPVGFIWLSTYVGS